MTRENERKIFWAIMAGASVWLFHWMEGIPDFLRFGVGIPLSLLVGFCYYRRTKLSIWDNVTGKGVISEFFWVVLFVVYSIFFMFLAGIYFRTIPFLVLSVHYGVVLNDVMCGARYHKEERVIASED